MASPDIPSVVEAGRILIVDDQANALAALGALLRKEGYDIETAREGLAAFSALVAFSPHVLLTNLNGPGFDGVKLMRRAQEIDPFCEVIVMTAFGDIEAAVKAMQEGASDFLTKPIHFFQLLVSVQHRLEHRQLQFQSQNLSRRAQDAAKISNLVGLSGKIRKLTQTIVQVAPSRATVLIAGETGTGKELVAAALHQHSHRVGQPFIKVNCAALTESLLESELFGHEKGSFTGAIKRRDGRFSQADGGTLFLDEISEITLLTQIKLLRVLQEREFERVGGNETIRVDVRIIAATNRDLGREVQEGRFRADLFYRLNVIPIMVPPLRERKSDIPLLAAYFLQKYARENMKKLDGFDSEALQVLEQNSWPGNIRELENCIERGAVVAEGQRLTIEDLSLASLSAFSFDAESFPEIPGSSLREIEKFCILKALEKSGGSTSRAASALRISHRKIQYKLSQYRAEKNANKVPNPKPS